MPIVCRLNPASCRHGGAVEKSISDTGTNGPIQGLPILLTSHLTTNYVEKLHGGLGVHVLNDKQGEGVFNTYNVNVMYAYHFQATRRLFFSGGIQAGMGQRSFDPLSLVFGDMIDPVSGGISPD